MATVRTRVLYALGSEQAAWCRCGNLETAGIEQLLRGPMRQEVLPTGFAYTVHALLYTMKLTFDFPAFRPIVQRLEEMLSKYDTELLDSPGLFTTPGRGSTMAAIKLIKIGAQWCPPCRTMKRAGTLEKFSAAHADVPVEEYDLPDVDEGDARKLTREEKKAEQISEKYEVSSIPAILFVDSAGEVLVRKDEALSFPSLEKAYKKAVATLAERAKEDEEALEEDDDNADDEDTEG